MIRKAVIAVLTLGAVVIALASGASHVNFDWEVIVFDSFVLDLHGTSWSFRMGNGDEGFLHVTGQSGRYTVWGGVLSLYYSYDVAPYTSEEQLERSFGGGGLSGRAGVFRDDYGGASNVYDIELPFCLLFAVFATYPTIAFIRGPLRQWRRRKRGLCVNCGYNLTGNVTGVCSECGETTRHGCA